TQTANSPRNSALSSPPHIQNYMSPTAVKNACTGRRICVSLRCGFFRKPRRVLQRVQPRVEYPRHRADRRPIVRVRRAVLLAMNLQELREERHDPFIQASPLDRIAHQAAAHDVIEPARPAIHLGHLVVFRPEPIATLAVVTNCTLTLVWGGFCQGGAARVL